MIYENITRANLIRRPNRFIAEVEIEPDEEMPRIVETAKLLQVLEGEDVEKYDCLLSLAVTGGDENWI